MKKILIIFLLLITIPVNASSIVMDIDSNRILYEENKDDQRLIASITKIMTAIITIENNKDLNKLIPVLVSLIGGGLGILIYFTSRELLKVNTIYEALMIGLVSGAASTGTNQIIKKIFGGNKDDIK